MGRRPVQKPRRWRFSVAVAMVCALAGTTARAEEAWQRHVSRARFVALAIRLAPKVDLFASIWDVDPTAEIYGGSARDYFWWLRRELAKCQTAICVDQFVERMEASPIEARTFLLGNGDVDVLGTGLAQSAAFDRSHFKRIDVSDPRRYDPRDPLYEEERKQGALPMEKLRLGRNGLGAVAEEFANGIDDIYWGRPRLVLTPTIRETDGFRGRENHPILLALRWIRQAGVAYAHRWGKVSADDGPLAAVVDADALETATAVATSLAAHPEELQPFLENPRFVHRLNRARARLFEGFTHAEAARHLYDLVGIDHALMPFAERLDPFFTVTFKKDWSPATLRRHRAKLPAAAAALGALADYLDQKNVARDGVVAGEVELFHGTWGPATYRNIATHGILPSERGLAGMGVYAVDRRSADYAKKWRDPTGKGYALRLCLKADATFVDLTSPEGIRLMDAFRKLLPTLGSPWTEGHEEDALANYLGIDVLKYSYNDAHAYVIKNGAVVLRSEAWSHPLRSLAELREAVQSAQDQVAAMAVLRKAVRDDVSVATHLDYLLSDLPLERRIEAHLEIAPPDGFENATMTIETLNRYRRKHKDVLPRATWARFYATVPVKKLLREHPEERTMRAIAAVAEAWEFYPLVQLLQEGGLVRPTLLGGCIERTLRERRGWMRRFLDPIRKASSVMQDLVVFQRRPLLYVELLEFLERERPDVFDASGWRNLWSFVDFDASFVRMYMHVPKQRTHGPLLAPQRLKELLRAAFRVAHKAPQVLDQLRVRIKSLKESRLWAAIDETLVEVEAWDEEHSRFLAGVLPDLPDDAKAWDVVRREALAVPAQRRLYGYEAEASAARLVLEATRGRFGAADVAAVVLEKASGAYHDGRKLLATLCANVVHEASRSESVQERWREAVAIAHFAMRVLGEVPADLEASPHYGRLKHSLASCTAALAGE